MNHHIKTFVFLLAGLLLLNGCSTQQAAKQLATTTSLNTAILSNQLQQLSAQHKQLTQSRVNQIARLHHSINSVRIRNELDLALMEVSDNRTAIGTYERLNSWLAKVDQILQQENDPSIIKANLEKELSPLNSKSQQLNLVAKKLAELGKDKKLTVRAKFYADFIKQVSKDVKEGLKDEKDLDSNSIPATPLTTPASLNTVMASPVSTP